ncbi:MAG: FAD-dependent oxidoreductase [Thermaceae bacterium]|nr:FAD-dependent oxidoreductase [Thermaceae bacterium]
MKTQYSADYVGPVQVLVVGAGLAGLAAARDLARAGLRVHLLDKSRGVSGRAATRWLELDGKTLRIDHGAQYFTAKGDGLRIILPDLVEQGIVREWAQGFPVLSENGIETRTSRHPRYICPEGMSALGKAFLKGIEDKDLHLPLETKALVTQLYRSESDGHWQALLENGEIRSGHTLLLNLPAPQALKLSEEFLKPEVKMALEAVRFAPCWTLVLVLESLPYLDWVGLEIKHPVLAWAALDHTKRMVEGPPVLVLQATPQWSQEHLEQTPEEVLPLLLAAARELLGDWVTRYRLALAHRWRYAKPIQIHPWPFLAQDNLVFCGDWCGGARIESALESGWAAADYLLRHLSD